MIGLAAAVLTLIVLSIMAYFEIRSSRKKKPLKKALD
jgi:hypothetical protein